MRKTWWILCLLIAAALVLALGLRQMHRGKETNNAAQETAPPAAAVTAPPVREASRPEPTPETEPELLPPEFFSDAAFVGDSITGTLQAYTYGHEDLGEPLFVMEASWSIRAIVDFGKQVLYEGRYMSLQDALNRAGVSRVFILLGTNDIGVIGVEKTAEKLELLIDSLQEAMPKLEIYLQSCTPMYGPSQKLKLNNDFIAQYNLRMREVAVEKGCCYVEISEALRDEQGDLLPEYSQDSYVHLTSKAGEVWAQALKNPENYSDLKN